MCSNCVVRSLHIYLHQCILLHSTLQLRCFLMELQLHQFYRASLTMGVKPD